MAYVTTNQTITNTTTLTDVTDLVVALDASSTYAVEVCLHITESAPYIKVQFEPVTNWTGQMRNIWDANNFVVDAFAPNRQPNVNGARMINIQGIITTDGAGDLQLQFAQGLADVKPTTVGKGSYLIATKLN